MYRERKLPCQQINRILSWLACSEKETVKVWKDDKAHYGFVNQFSDTGRQGPGEKDLIKNSKIANFWGTQTLYISNSVWE